MIRKVDTTKSTKDRGLIVVDGHLTLCTEMIDVIEDNDYGYTVLNIIQLLD